MIAALMTDAYHAVCALAAIFYLAPLIAGLKATFSNRFNPS